MTHSVSEFTIYVVHVAVHVCKPPAAVLTNTAMVLLLPHDHSLLAEALQMPDMARTESYESTPGTPGHSFMRSLVR